MTSPRRSHESLEAGRLLIAAPGMDDPNFDETVVYLFDHDHSGSAGVILNRPSDLAVHEALPDLPVEVMNPPVVFFGGPVRTEHAVVLGARDAEIATLDQSTSDWSGYDVFRVYAGYAGWAPGQLDDEVRLGGWFVVSGSVDDVMLEDPHGLWRDVLARQPEPLRRYRSYPSDLRLN